MSLFSKILDKLGFETAAAKFGASPPSEPMPQPAQSPAPALAAQSMDMVDVVAKLEKLSASHAEKLNWQASIVDLLKLLGLDSSFPARKQLAGELGCPPDKMQDSAQMNMWLHKVVLQKLAENGGNIPKQLLH